MSQTIRYPRYAGSFYASTKSTLKRQIEECFLHRFGPKDKPILGRKGSRKIFGLISPHAGYIYSGPVAAHAYYQLSIDGLADKVVILGPNHHGRGSGVAVMCKGSWRTPLGDVKINTELATEILNNSNIIDLDESAHIYEHSIEVQLPFLQYIYESSFEFVPICFLMQDVDTCREVGLALAESLKDKNAVLIASTDMTHYEPQKEAVEKDKLLLKAIINLDEDLLYSVLKSYNISACGYGPVTALITAAKQIKTRNVELLNYKTSGDITGDTNAVVGYASLIFEK